MQEFDYVIVGAGVAGSVIAARLSEDAGAQVALIEAGDENPMDIGRSQGAFFLTWGSDKNWAYTTVPQAGLGGRSIDHPRGRAVGGSNVLNVGAWLRGRPEDYDAWEAAGAAGWNGAAALDAFLAVEQTNRSPLRGHDGPLAMTDLPTPTDLSERLRDAFVETGLGKRGDSAGPDPFVVDRFQTLFVDGVRRTVADAYLADEVRARDNLTIVTGAHVTRILIEDGRATGVEIRTSDGSTRAIAARREVVLSAGTFNSPQLLMLSGIGPRDHLASLGIDTILDAPAVGENLRDHIYAHVYTLAAAGVDGSIPPSLGEAEIARWFASHDGPASYFTENGVGWAARDGGSVPDYELLLSYNTVPGNFGATVDPDRSGTTIGVVLLQPQSRGTVRLASADPLAKPVIDPRYLSAAEDVETLIAGLRIAQRMAQTDVLKPWAEQIHPAPEASDADLAAFIPGDIGTVFHPVGTVRMGATDDPSAVVDERLRVKGISGLRVVDASVMPSLIRGHTMAPTVFIGHRAAELIAEDAV